jgi:uncharacterized protein
MKKRLYASFRAGRFFRIALPPIAILLAGFLALFGILVHKVSHPAAFPEPVNPSYYSLTSLDVVFSSEDRAEISGWWIPGLRGAPGIVLSPGYGMSRSDVLSLAAVLHGNGFNVLTYDQRGSGVPPQKASTFGLYEANDLIKAIQYLQSRQESDRKRLGVWGVDVGALAALKAAVPVPEVRAIAVDGAFESVYDFLDLRISEDFGDYSLLQFGCRQIFGFIHLTAYSSMNAQLPVQALSDRTILFIHGENRKQLGRLTSALYNKIKPQKEIISLKTSRMHLMSGEDLKSYDRQVSNFFQVNLH